MTFLDLAMLACSTKGPRSSARTKSKKGLPMMASGSTLKINSHEGEAYNIPKLRENRLRIMQARASGSMILGFQENLAAKAS